jgi:hypothetical protein
LQMLEEGYGVYAVEDASRAMHPAAQETALRRLEQAGGVSVTALQVLLEFQRDWGRPEHREEVRAIVRERCGSDDAEARLPALGSYQAAAGRQRKGSHRTLQRE